MLAHCLKKKLFVFVVLAFALCLVPARAFAAAEPDATSDELLAGYIEQRFNEELPTSEVPRLRARPSNGLTGNDAAVYEYLKQEIAKVAAGERSSTVFRVPVSVLPKTTWTAADLGIESVADEHGMYTDEAYLAIFTHITINTHAIINALLTDCPSELYWFDKTYTTRMTGAGYYPVLSDGEYVVRLDPDSAYKISMPVSADYSVSGDVNTYEVDTSTGARVSNAVATAKSVATSGANLSPYYRLAFFKNWICGAVEYDRAAASNPNRNYGDTSQLVSVFDGDPSTNVMCEGYAKAFQYLCDLADIPGVSCYTASGTGLGGPHMWNLVNMDDGKVYLADVANCDSGTVGYPNQLFLVPYTSGSVGAGYQFKTSYGTYSYTYNSDTLSLYSTSDLTVSGTKYDHNEPGWNKDESGAWVFYDDYGNMMCDHWESYGGAWYYFGADGRLVWNGWSYYKGVRYYMGKNGRLARNTWAVIDGRYYYIGSDYRPVVNGWVSYGGKWYYMDESGNPVVSDWVQYQGTWYHFSASGVCDRTWKA